MTQPAKRFAQPLDILEVTPETVTERLSYRLRHVVGTGRPWSYQDLSARTGIDTRTLKAYVQGTACPSLVKYKRLLAVLGPEIGTELNVMKGWLPRDNAIPPEAIDLRELRRELARISCVIADILGNAHEDAPPCDLDGAGGAALDESGLLDDPVTIGRGDQALHEPLPIDRIDTAAVAARLSHRLRLMIGQDRRWPVTDVSERTGIDRRTLQSYLDGAACPNLARFLRLSYLLGPEIGVELAHMIGWEPRYSTSRVILREDVKELGRTVLEARAAVDRILEHAGSHDAGAQLIRACDTLGPPPADPGQGETVIPFSRQM